MKDISIDKILVISVGLMGVGCALGGLEDLANGCLAILVFYWLFKD